MTRWRRRRRRRRRRDCARHRRIPVILPLRRVDIPGGADAQVLDLLDEGVGQGEVAAVGADGLAEGVADPVASVASCLLSAATFTSNFRKHAKFTSRTFQPFSHYFGDGQVIESPC